MRNNTSEEIGREMGIIGTIIAIVLSYSTNGSIGWAFIHGLLNWFYVLYHAVYN